MMRITAKENTPIMLDRKKRNATQNRYNRETTTALSIKLNNRTDADILEFLTQVPNKQGLIKNLIRKYMTDQSGAPAPAATSEED